MVEDRKRGPSNATSLRGKQHLSVPSKSNLPRNKKLLRHYHTKESKRTERTEINFKKRPRGAAANHSYAVMEEYLANHKGSSRQNQAS